MGIHVRPVTISLVLVGNVLFVMLLLEYYWCYICSQFREHLDTVSINSKTTVFLIILKKNYFLWIIIFLRFFRYLFLLTKSSQIYHLSKKTLTTVNHQQVSQHHYTLFGFILILPENCFTELFLYKIINMRKCWQRSS